MSPKINQPDVETTTTIDIKIKSKEIDITKMPCANCEWRYSLFCPRCEMNKKGNVKVY